MISKNPAYVTAVQPRTGRPRALGITFNLQNSGSVAELRLAEASYSRQYKPQLFEQLHAATGV